MCVNNQHSLFCIEFHVAACFLQELGVQIEYHAYQCFNLTDGTAVLVIIKNVYLALLQIIGLVLAIQTRKVTVKVLNDSKYIAALIYISSITLVVLVLTTFTLRNFINIYQLLYSGGLLVAITAFLALIFIPKVRALHHYYVSYTSLTTKF